MEDIIIGTSIKKNDMFGAINPISASIALALNNLLALLWVFSQTKSLFRVQGVLIPMKKFRLAFFIKIPIE